MVDLTGSERQAKTGATVRTSLHVIGTSEPGPYGGVPPTQGVGKVGVPCCVKVGSDENTEKNNSLEPPTQGVGKVGVHCCVKVGSDENTDKKPIWSHGLSLVGGSGVVRGRSVPIVE